MKKNIELSLVERLLAVIALQQIKKNIEDMAELSIINEEKAEKRMRQINALILKLD